MSIKSEIKKKIKEGEIKKIQKLCQIKKTTFKIIVTKSDRLKYWRMMKLKKSLIIKIN